jgi:2'-5' RNA ligase
MSRLFVAVWPPEEVVDELTALRRKDQRGVRFVAPESWHITLRFLGEADPGAVIDALDECRLEPAVARVGPAVDLVAERALAIPVSGVEDLAESVRAATAHLGQPIRRRFVGHLTVARLKPNADMPRTLGEMVQAEFVVHEVALVQSRLDPEGARYSTLHSWPVPTRP